MYQEIKTIEQNIFRFIKFRNNTPSVLIGFDYEGRQEILLNIFNKFISNQSIIPFFLDLDYFFWSYEHFINQFKLFIKQTSLKQARIVDEKSKNLIQNYKDRQIIESIDKDNFILQCFELLQNTSKTNEKPYLFIIDNLHYFQKTFNIHEHNSTYTQLKNVIDKYENIYFVLGGRNAFKAEKKYSLFLHDFALETMRLKPLLYDEFKKWRTDNNLYCAPKTCEKLYSLTNGIWGYLPLLQKLFPAKDKDNRIDKNDLLNRLNDPQSELYLYCQHRYYVSIERARGFGKLRIILSILTQQSGQKLSQVSRKIGKSFSVTLDSLNSLLEVGLIIKKDKKYFLTDRIMQIWLKKQEQLFLNPVNQITSDKNIPLKQRRKKKSIPLPEKVINTPKIPISKSKIKLQNKFKKFREKDDFLEFD